MQLIVINEELANFVSRVMKEKNLSTYEVARRSGNEISQSTVNKILNRDIRSHSVETLSALAKGLGVPEETMFRVARGLPPESPTERFEIYAERFDAADLTEFDWRILENYFEHQIRILQSLKSPSTDSPKLRSNFKRRKIGVRANQSEKKEGRQKVRRNDETK